MKRWLFPVFCALAGHAVLFMCNPGWLRPPVPLPQNRSVSISLVPPPQSAERRTVKPLEANPPATVPPLKTVALPSPPDPVPIPRADPSPEPTPAPEPPPLPEAPVRTPAEDPTAETTTSFDHPPQTEPTTPTEKSEPDRAAVQASVPLYHLNPAPDYPAVARRRNYQGTVVLDVLVDRRGRAVEVRVAQSSGHPILDRSAVDGVRRWRFEPARRLGHTVEMWVQVPVRFALE